jgi:hypothetical protein
MHGKQYSLKIKQAAEQLRREAISSHAAEYQIMLPPGQYAVFYSEPIVSTKLAIQVYIYNGLSLNTTFTVLTSYPDLAEFQNSSTVPVQYALTASTFPYGSNDGPYAPVLTITTTAIDPGAPDAGVLISMFNGEIDTAGQPVAQNIYMEIKAHP